MEPPAALRDPRVGRRLPYPLRDMLLLVPCATLCGMHDSVEVELWAPVQRGIPSHDTRDDVMDGRDAELCELCFVE